MGAGWTSEMGESIAEWKVRAGSFMRLLKTRSPYLYYLSSPKLDETQRVPGSPVPAESPFAFCLGTGKGRGRTLEDLPIMY